MSHDRDFDDNRFSDTEFDPFAGPAIALTASTTEPQREIWTGAGLSDEASLAFNESVSLRLRGALDHAALRASLDDLVARHESLAATFSRDGLTMLIAPPPSTELRFGDWSDRPPTEQRAALAALLDDEVQTPFDLERGPLVRARLCRLAAKEHVLVFTAHHIVCDGWSTAVLVKDWGALYSARRRQQAAGLPPAESWSAYARACSAPETAAQLASDEAYWLAQLAGELPVLDLPTDRPRPPLKTYASRRIDMTLDVGLVGQLKKAGAKERASLFVTLLAGWKALLCRLSGQEDLIVGIPAAGQAAGGHAQLVGHCVNTLALRSRIAPAEPFTALLASLRQTMLDALDHQQLTFGALLQKLPLPRDPSRLPLCSTIFNLDRGLPDQELGFADLDAHLSTNPRRFETFDLFVNAVEVEERVELEVQYNTDLYDPETVQRWLGAYQALLRAVAGDMRTPIALLPVVTDEERALLARWNERAVPFPRELGLHRLVEAQVDRSPDALAVEIDGRSLTYGELDRRANRLARRLRALGVRRGQMVGLCVERGLDMFVGVFGILKAGAAYVPLDPGYPLERLAFMVEDARMEVLVSERRVLAEVPLASASPLRALVIDDELALGGQSDERLPPSDADADPRSPCYVIYTSGSTGKPKGVIVPHEAAVNLVCSVQQTPGLAATDVVLAITTLSFDIALSEVIAPLTVGAKIVVASREVASDGQRLLQLVRSARVTFVDATPATYRLLLAAGWDGGEGLKVICTGEAMPKDLAGELLTRCASVWNGYGPTETTVWSTFWEVKPGFTRVLIGRPVANTRCYVLDGRLQEVPLGAKGELYIGGGGVTLGYLGRPELTQERFLPDPFAPEGRMYKTGDVARWLPDGNLECLGRNDGQVKLRGFRIELGEIEEALRQQAAVAEAAVVVREDRPGDRRLVAYVVAAGGDGAATKDTELRAHLKVTLPDYMIPSAFVRLPAMRLTPSGKIDRRALPAPHDTGPQGEDAFVGPRTPTEEMLADLWKETLGVGRVSVRDDFFMLGGHSLLASQVLARLRRDHGVELSFRKMFEAPTIETLAALIDARGGQMQDVDARAQSVPARPAGAGPAPLSLMQDRLRLLEEMHPRQRIVHSLPAAWRLRGKLDVGLLERALEAFAARHEAMRTSVKVTPAGPVQEVVPTVIVPLPLVDLSGLSQSEREAAVQAFFDAEMGKPFDLGVAPLFRAALLRLGPEEHIFFSQRHNLVWDGWSFDIFLRELGALCAALADGRAPALPPPPITYSDFAVWHHGFLQGPQIAAQAAWWRKQLEGAPDLELPSDRPRPVEPSFGGANEGLMLSRLELEALTQLARDHGATLFMVLFSAMSVMLHRYTGQRDLLVGTPVRARTRPEMEDVVGPFLNAVVLRARVEPELAFVDLLARVREVTLDSFSHQELPLEVLGARAPFVRAFFSLQDAKSRGLAIAGCAVSQVHVLPPASANDLMLWAMETRDGLLTMLNYSTDLFDRETMVRFLEQLRALLAAIVRDPRQRVRDLPLVPPAQRARIDALGRPPAAGATTTVHRLVEERAADAPETLALPGVSYRELERRADALARYLRNVGAGRDAPVALALPRAPDLVVALVAGLKAGAPVVVLDPAHPRPWLAARLADARPAVILTLEDLREQLPDPSRALVCALDTDAARIAAVPSTSVRDADVAPEDAAAIVHEPDPTGRPRGVPVTHAALAALLRSLRELLAVDAADVAFACSPLGIDATLVELLLPLVSGACLRLAEHELEDDPDACAEACADASLLVAPAAILRDLIDAGWRGGSRVKLACCGPAGGLGRDLQERAGRVLQLFGAPEAGIFALAADVGPSVTPSHVALGRPLAGVLVRVLDDSGAPVPLGVPGELCLGGVGLGPGYRARPELDAARFVADPFDPTVRLFRSGERVRLCADGTLVHLGGPGTRAHLRGARVDLDEIAAALERLPAIAEAAVALRPDRTSEPRLVAYVVPRPGHAGTETERRQLLRRMLPRSLVPQLFVELEQLPRHAGGVVDRGRLPSPFASTEVVPPRNPPEALIAEVWQAALGLAQVSVYDNFFDLGGHSLLCFQVIGEIEKRAGHRLSPRVLLLNTLEQVAAQLVSVPAPAQTAEQARSALGSRMMQRLRAAVGRRQAGES